MFRVVPPVSGHPIGPYDIEETSAILATFARDC